MESEWLSRVRWRHRGAWLWPVFVVMTLLDAVVTHLRPPAGDSESLAAGVVTALALNVLVVLLLSRPLGALIRRRRRDLPGVVARNYAGTSVVLAVSAALLAAGLVHRATIIANEKGMREASVRAAAWIGDRAPPEFRRNLKWLDTFAIQGGSVYRSCVPSYLSRRNFCVIVKTRLPFPQGVSFAGSEPNSVFSRGVG